MLTQSPSRTLVRAQEPGDCGSVSQHCPSDLGPLRAPGSVAPGRAGRSGLRGALRGAAEPAVDEDEDEHGHEDRAPDDGRGRPDLHDRANHANEDDDANDDGSQDAHGLIVSPPLVCVFRQTGIALIAWPRHPEPQEY